MSGEGLKNPRQIFTEHSGIMWFKAGLQKLHPQGESNPRCRTENPESWATRRWGQTSFAEDLNTIDCFNLTLLSHPFVYLSWKHINCQLQPGFLNLNKSEKSKQNDP